ncbi:MAG: hypothetical protein EBR09_12140 [Proteobacteria bacterium]|nr:hypothetical protein [Pseudomonadota bacterium]
MLCGTAPVCGHAAGTFGVTARLADSEKKHFTSFDSEAEASFSGKTENGWSASSQINLLADESRVSSPNLHFTLTEAGLSKTFERQTLSIGRLLLRSEATEFSEGANTFMLDEIAADGIAYSREEQNLRWSLIAGAPSVAALKFDFSSGSTKFSFIYKGQRHKHVPAAVKTAAAPDNPDTHAAHTQLAEAAIKTKSETLETEGMFQLMSQGARRNIKNFNAAFGDSTVGSIDLTQPASVNIYRAGAQIKFPLDAEKTSSEWLVLSAAAGNELKSYEDAALQPAGQPLSGHDAQMAASLELRSSALSAEIGGLLRYSSAPEFAFNAEKQEGGEYKLRPLKGQLWSTIRFNF